MRALPEWIGTTDDAAIPPRVQLRLYTKQNGNCAICTRMLHANQWACDHIVALINGGKHAESNLQAVCVSPCHSDKTRADMQVKRITYRNRKKHAGVKKPRTITRWRKFNGDIVTASRER